MQPPPNLLLRLEFTWWAVTLLLAVGILLPLRAYWNTYSFLWSNIIFILTFVTIARYIFLLPYTFLAHREGLKVSLFFLCIPVIFLLIQELNQFQIFLDYTGREAILGGHSAQKIDNRLINYTYSEMLLFSVGSIISAIIFPFRLLLSVWRKRNRGTV